LGEVPGHAASHAAAAGNDDIGSGFHAYLLILLAVVTGTDPAPRLSAAMFAPLAYREE
jgi:hypothetical protein